MNAKERAENLMRLKKEQKQHLIDMMKADEELGLYDETLEEAAENGWLNDNSMSSEHKEGFENGFKQGAKWQEEKQDDFAIGFCKFIETRCVKTEYLHQYIMDGKEHHLTSLLQIYKKEKGL
jgi:hypothetical protein